MFYIIFWIFLLLVFPVSYDSFYICTMSDTVCWHAQRRNCQLAQHLCVFTARCDTVTLESTVKMAAASFCWLLDFSYDSAGH